MEANTMREIFASNLRRIADEKQITQADIVAETKCSSATVSDWFNGKKYPRPNRMQRIADILGVCMSDLIENHSQPSLPPDAIPYAPTQRIPILGRISAGLPLYADEQIEGYTYTDLNHGGEYFALRVHGDSMNAIRIYDGDLLIIRKQDVVEDGEIAVVMVNDDEATVKCWHRRENIVMLEPKSTNPTHQMQIYDAKETPIRVIGKVVQNQIMY